MPTLYSMVNETRNRNRILEMRKLRIWFRLGIRVRTQLFTDFGATVCKTVSPMLSDRCLVCDVGVLWPNGLTDQYATWHAGKPRPWRHC